MASYFKSKSTYNAGKRIKLIDNEGHATIINNPEKSVWYMKDNTGAGISSHPTGLSSQMLDVVAKIKDNVGRGIDCFTGIAESGGKIVLQSTATNTTTTTMSPNPAVSKSEPVVVATRTQVTAASNEGFIVKFFRWLFGF